MPLRVGEAFERYRIDALLGEGGMGAVYRAYDTRLARTVALKVLKRSDGASEGTARVLREARAAAALTHPNAIVTHDVGEHDGQPYIAMEFVEGRSLRELVGDASVDLSTRVRWLGEIARVLGAAHEAGIVHRDIKPENVMIRKDGSVKVLDFGIARRAKTVVDPSAPTAHAVDELATITAEGVVVGTPLYMAPEQIRSEPLDGRADQFAWGVLAYELLTGRVPWTASDGAGVIAQIVSTDPRPLATAAPDVPERVAAAVERALAKKTADRFATMGDVVVALAPARRSLGPKDSARPSGRRRFALAGAVALVALAAAVNVFRSKPAPSVAAEPADARAIGLGDLPDPVGCNEAATREYRIGLLTLRDRGWEAAQHRFDEAAKLDPSCAAVQLRSAFIRIDTPAELDVAREAYQRALAGREKLSARDRSLLEALAALYAGERPDRQALAARAAKLAEKHPHDAELVLTAAYLDRDPARRESGFARARALDPRYSDAWQDAAIAMGNRGDLPAATAIAEQCVVAAPASVDCRHELLLLAVSAGECKKVETHARAGMRAYPEGSIDYVFLAQALAANGSARGPVEEALGQGYARSKLSRAAVSRAVHLAHVAVFFGAFAEAHERAEEAERLARAATEESVQVSVALLRAGIAAEEQDASASASIAAEFLARRLVWTLPSIFEFSSPSAQDGPPRLIEAAALGGRMTPAERDRAMAGWREGATSLPPGWGWLLGMQAPTTPEDSIRALAGAPPNAARGILRSRSAGSLSLAALRSSYGVLLRRAGRIDEALVALGLAASDCMPLVDAIASVRAHAELGEAFEEKGDKGAACREYRFVLDRWGSVDKSITAARVRARARDLGCD